ncbi:YggS family pyridoxal phosphate-dependent enzyme [Campylobacter majalis]|uniref:YggS family pyridoxal phosphate-dependent enzyme n=1 Tax=Campylobacter majalis TaxID=2790656 RepID=UPI003D69E583
MINLMALKAEISAINPDVRLIAVSKNVDIDKVLALNAQGQLEYGENRVQEMARKQSLINQSLNLKWHMIGRLQNNKINQLISLRPTLWQSCESIEKAKAVDKRLNYKLDTLLQINSANEDTKQGVMVNDAIQIYDEITQTCPNLNLIGVMSIGANSDDMDEIKRSFELTRNIFDKLPNAKICSMGMSGDYHIAIKHGSNMIRLGTMLYA